ncbi:hypothetical protein BDZ97DRAFT_2038640 [Flammula alnicola]|nr:hypothetical protein BDZ97DRAFT_2038640 [Flammula alnicola]
MLPHILHSTGRAVAVVQNQTHTIRNVLQLQSSGPSSGSGSNWGNGPGPGSSKYGAGSRFYAGYNSAGRAVTQANAVTSHEVSQSDDTEEFTPRRTILPAPQKRHRMRSSSVSIPGTGRNERGEKMGVLMTVQLHTRGKHAFAPVESMASAKERLLADPLPIVQPTQPLLVRRNSTSAPLSPLLNASEPLVPPLPTPPPEGSRQQKRKPSVSATAESPKAPASPQQKQSTATDPSAPQTVTPPPTPEDDSVTHAGVLRSLGRKGDATSVANSIHANPWNPLTGIIKLYNIMLEKSIVPDVDTYDNLIHALTKRDLEIHRAKVSLELRNKRTALVGRTEAVAPEDDQARINELNQEDNFASAMSLFEGVLAIGGKDQLHESTFVRLLKCAANNADVNSAIHIFAQMEARRETKVPHGVYRYLILTFSNVGQIDQAEEIFQEYVSAGKAGKLRHFSNMADVERQAQIMTWNVMIEAYFRAAMPDKAIGLVDQMVNSVAGDHFTSADVPITTSSTFSTVINGFLQAGDIQSALAWFDKLLGQERAPEDPFQGLGGNAMRPDALAWFLMLDALAIHGKIDDLNRLYKILKVIHVEDHFQIRSSDRLIVHTANMENLKNNDVDNATAIETLQFLLEDLQDTLPPGFRDHRLTLDICRELVSRGAYDVSCRAFYEFITKQTADAMGDSTRMHTKYLRLQDLTTKFIAHVYDTASTGLGELSFLSALTLARLAFQLSLKPQLKFAPFFLDSYGRTKYLNLIPYEDLILEDWNILFTYAVHFETNALDGNPEGLPELPGFVYGGLISLLEDLAGHGLAFDVLDEDIRQRVIGVIDRQFGEQARVDVLARFGPSYLEAAQQYDQLRYSALENALTQPPDAFLQPVESQVLANEYQTPLKQDAYLGKSINTLLGPLMASIPVEPLNKAYRMFEEGLQKGIVPNLGVIGRLIQSEGRVRDTDKVRELYTAAQTVLQTIPAEHQLYEWAHIEDNMIIALAHAGHVDAAHVHRFRILDQGLCPSADSYGILIQLVKDTTDDTSGAMALFQEAVERGVKPNMYLYNNIISKLSKARKADYALELFQQMKASGIRASSITYGAVIGACARVGDVASAESLFREMVHSPNFKPRVPPYNTMMQLHTTTKPYRLSVLYYYEEMEKAGVKPSAHTYKLLLDAYGSIEPVDLPSMEEVFSKLQKDTSVEITGAHFASLINAYGCVSKDLDRALSMFESMGTYPRAPKPDAVAFEAVINVIVAHKRTDLLPVYVNKMIEAGVHMTAYIANFLIKGYANVGDMEQARAIFESLSNPPTGVAAPNNHAPHSPDMNEGVSVTAPVYREPSTWEVMVRAEFGAGNRDAAIELLERLKERQYPEAVYNRISGVLTDYSVPQ